MNRQNNFERVNVAEQPRYQRPNSDQVTAAPKETDSPAPAATKTQEPGGHRVRPPRTRAVHKSQQNNFEWEKVADLPRYQRPNSNQVTTAPKETDSPAPTANKHTLAGDITTSSNFDGERVVRSAAGRTGFDAYADDLPSVDRKGLRDKTCEVTVRASNRPPGIAGGAHFGEEELDVGTGDHGDTFAHASNATEDPSTTRTGKTMPDVSEAIPAEYLLRSPKTPRRPKTLRSHSRGSTTVERTGRASRSTTSAARTLIGLATASSRKSSTRAWRRKCPNSG